MPPPQKGYKTLSHRNVQYRWIMQNRTGFNELLVEAKETVNGAVLKAELPRIVTHDMVTEAIDFALANGWKPTGAATPFLCKRHGKNFQLL